MLSFFKGFFFNFFIKINQIKNNNCTDVKMSHDDGRKNFTPLAPTPLPY